MPDIERKLLTVITEALLDDVGALGEMRIQRTRQVFDRTDVDMPRNDRIRHAGQLPLEQVDIGSADLAIQRFEQYSPRFQHGFRKFLYRQPNGITPLFHDHSFDSSHNYLRFNVIGPLCCFYLSCLQGFFNKETEYASYQSTEKEYQK